MLGQKKVWKEMVPSRTGVPPSSALYSSISIAFLVKSKVIFIKPFVFWWNGLWYWVGINSRADKILKINEIFHVWIWAIKSEQEKHHHSPERERILGEWDIYLLWVIDCSDWPSTVLFLRHSKEAGAACRLISLLQ